MTFRTLTLFSLLAQSACIGFQVRKENNALGPLSEFEGTVSAGDVALEEGRPIIVLLVREDGAKPRVESSAVLYHPGRYHFFANEGRYSVFAFEDLNSNLRIDDNEPRGAAAKQLLLHEGKLHSPVDLTLKNDPSLAAIDWHPTHDEVIKIDDDRLRERLGRKGHWAPAQWRAESGDDRLFLMEPYDPHRTPVVFVPGVGGTPDDMKAVIESLDHSRYQVWLFWYASGMRMSLSAQSLESVLDEYRVLHDFSNVVVVAQCVGGMVARDAITQMRERTPPYSVAALVTFSTPWTGHRMAESGTSISPMTVPAWIDMSEGSAFQKSIIATAVPEVPHYMFFSYGKGSDVGDDGTVALTSELDLTMQRRATEIIGFSETHMGIVTNKESLAHFNEILGKVQQQIAARQQAAPTAPASAAAR
ncbi:MAG: alpha/beta hydrolase [Archangiaceae bacterium]|nr:alpha/beta hydrolase [Archangiaceae bacterium]